MPNLYSVELQNLQIMLLVFVKLRSHTMKTLKVLQKKTTTTVIVTMSFVSFQCYVSNAQCYVSNAMKETSKRICNEFIACD